MAARTIERFTPADAVTNGGTFGTPGQDGQNRPYIRQASGGSFDFANWIAPQGITPPLTAILKYRMVTATSGNVEARIAIEAITPGDAVDTDSASSFATDNDSGDVAVPGTAGYIGQISWTLTNNDTIAAGDVCRFRVSRIAPSTGAATGDWDFLALELQDDGG